MERKIYSPEQIKLLSANPNVVKCSDKAITYRKEFKLKAVQAYYQEGLGPNAIFERAGFNLNILGTDKPKACLKMWRKIYKAKGQAELLKENRGKSGGRPRKLQESDDPEYLKAKIVYLEAENDFLRKLKTKPKA